MLYFCKIRKFKKSPIDIYFTSFKTFFYFYSYPKHNNMIKNCSQTMGLLQVISAHSGTSGHTERLQSHGIGKKQDTSSRFNHKFPCH